MASEGQYLQSESFSWRRKELQLKLNTKGCCFICFHPTLNLQDNYEDYHGECLSLQNILRHLKIQPEKVAKSLKTPTLLMKSVLDSIDNMEIVVDLCGSCLCLGERISSLFQQLEVIQMEIDSCVERVHERMESSKREELAANYSQLMTSEICSLSMLPFVDELRKCISEKCSTIRVGSNAEVRISRVKILPRNAVEEDEEPPFQPLEYNVPTNLLAPGDPLNLDEAEDCLLPSQEEVEEIMELHDLITEPVQQIPPGVDPLDISGSSSPPHNLMKRKKKRRKWRNGGIVSKRYKYNSKLGKWNCRKCGKEYNEKAAASNHFVTEHLKRRYKCDWCRSSSFKTPQGLKLHKQARTCLRRLAKSAESVYNYLCPLCNKTFVSLQRLKQHETRVHFPTQTFPCDICGQVFKTQCGQVTHKDRQHFKIDFTCPICNKKSLHRWAFKKHTDNCTKRLKGEVGVGQEKSVSDRAVLKPNDLDSAISAFLDATSTEPATVFTPQVPESSRLTLHYVADD